MTETLPREVSRGTMQIGGLELDVVHLDNGQRVVTAESMERFMSWLASGMSAGTAETQSCSGLQPASPTSVAGDAQDQSHDQ